MFLLKKSSLLIRLVIAFFLAISVINAQNCDTTIHSGEGTFYGGVAGSSAGNCGLPLAADDILHCALNTIDYNGSQACGACIKVEGTAGKSVVVKVVDRCPECKEGDVDLNGAAFALIDDPISGRIPITWKFVNCPLKSENQFIKINFKSGSTKYWTAIQIRNLTQAIESLEYKNSNGSWTAINRVLFNFFIEPSGINTPMTLRATSVLGEQLVFKNVAIDIENDFNTNRQFSNTCNEATLSNKLPKLGVQNLDISFLKGKIDIQTPFETYKLFDVSGNMLRAGTSTTTIAIEELPTGIYFLKIDAYKTIKFYKD
ncbi:expansin EXLX1 family cellulose-binding protein [Aquimarina agarivorans]|uniref:expansin EXLX1 family cellulose-binding protein n=1 Tax=Aquimarina agarivorans TaxID=980584 RepID=UPI000248F92A|nr:expansin EXLX1 family cellulose-binding protein [Aquimarina agarivorans]